MANKEEVGFPGLRWGRSGAPQACSAGWLTQGSRLSKGSMGGGSGHEDGASRGELLPSWPVEEVLRLRCHRTRRPRVLGEGERHCGGEGCGAP